MTPPKLPEWPEKPARAVHIGQSQWQDYHAARADAALARMEALVEVTTKWRKRMRHSMDDDDLQAVDELLAACERRSGG